MQRGGAVMVANGSLSKHNKGRNVKAVSEKTRLYPYKRYTYKPFTYKPYTYLFLHIQLSDLFKNIRSGLRQGLAACI